MVQEERTSKWSMNFRLLFRSLKHRNFRLFFIGQGISLIGTWMQMTAVAWLVWRLSHDALLLGLVGFAARIPTFVMAPFAGVLVDRMDRHRLIILTQVLSMAQALMLAGPAALPARSVSFGDFRPCASSSTRFTYGRELFWKSPTACSRPAASLCSGSVKSSMKK